MIDRRNKTRYKVNNAVMLRVIAGFKKKLIDRELYKRIKDNEMESKMLKLKFKTVDRGNSRIYLTTNKNLYCLQEGLNNGFSLNRCSLDGEPSHEVNINLVGSIEAPKESEQLVKSFFRGTLT